MYYTLLINRWFSQWQRNGVTFFWKFDIALWILVITYVFSRWCLSTWRFCLSTWWLCICGLWVIMIIVDLLIERCLLCYATEWCYVLLKLWYSCVDPCDYLNLFSLVSFYLEVLVFYLVNLYLWTLSYNDKGYCRLAYRKVIIVLHLKKYYFWGTLHVYIISSWTIFIWNLLILSDSGIYMKSIDLILC